MGRGAVGKEAPMPLLRQIGVRKRNLAAGNGEFDPGRPLCVWLLKTQNPHWATPVAWCPFILLAWGAPLPHPFNKVRKIWIVCKSFSTKGHSVKRVRSVAWIGESVCTYVC